MSTSLRLFSRLLLGAVIFFACSKQEGIRVFDASGGPGPDIAAPSTLRDTGSDVLSAPDLGNDVFSAPDAGNDVFSAPDSRADAHAVDLVARTCGNGIFEPGEGCDDGNTRSGDGCSPTCQLEDGCPLPPCAPKRACGNGILTSNEVCDDGNMVGGDGCSADCQAVEPGFRCRVPSRRCAPICGDRMLRDGETCDDGNTLGGDGCSAYCLTEPGWDCSSGTCVRVLAVDGGVDSGLLAPYCGDGVISGAEECDDGPTNGDGVYGGCTSKCFFGPFCGDGMVNGPDEQCDLAELNGTVSGKDGCTIGCRRPHYCGDGNVDTDRGEECDLGDRNGVKLDSDLNPSTAPEAMVLCSSDCTIPVVLTW